MSYRLGLDIGSNSIGWALIDCVNGNPQVILRAGVRIFDAGVGRDTSGKETAPGAKRRAASHSRRQTDRTKRRLNKLFALLQEENMLPGAFIRELRHDHKEISLEKDRILKELDSELAKRWGEKLSKRGEDPLTVGIKTHHNLPYLLRASALDQQLELEELGRALYHLAQRRGFAGRHKKAKGSKEKEEQGKMKEEISFLQQEIESSGSRTLGEFFLKYNPFKGDGTRIRGRYTRREMYISEFNLIWDKQAQFNVDKLTSELRGKIFDAIFHQRPLKSQKHLVGTCVFEANRKGAPWIFLKAQQYRLFQQLSHTRIILPDGTNRPLTDEERSKLSAALDKKKTLAFGTAKSILRLSEDEIINLEAGGEDEYRGNHTSTAIRKVMSGRWDELSNDQKANLVQEIYVCQSTDANFSRKLTHDLKLSAEDLERLLDINFEDGYCSLSAKAIDKLLPYLERGVSYSEAVKEVYGEQFHEKKLKTFDLLPSVVDCLPELRNPVVSRVLTELRKVVNALIKAYGKPESVHIELARDVKQTRKEREAATKKSRKNESERKRVRKIFEDSGINPSNQDIEKYLLAGEANWECPYTGTRITPTTLGDFDVEHIIPFSRCMDNSFANKTICLAEENRTVKSGKTPYEAYASMSEKWDAILRRVKNFQGDRSLKSAKLNRFLMQNPEEWEGFVSRQLNDTRYASRVAAEYIGLLFGGTCDIKGKRRVHAGRGQVTAFLRGAWNLNSILGDGGNKIREDHRHHAVDAIAIALTDARTIKLLSDASEQARRERRRLFLAVPAPWSGFLEQATNIVRDVIVSPRVSRKISGPLHEETLYSRPYIHPDGRKLVHVRKDVSNLTASDVSSIVDPKMREIVSSGGRSFIVRDKNTGEERVVPIRKVRISKNENVESIGSGPFARHVKPGSNSHIEVFETRTSNGAIKWAGRTITLLEATERLRKQQPVVNRVMHNARFLFSLTNGDVIEFEEEGRRSLAVIKAITFTESRDNPRIKFAPLHISKPGEPESKLLNPLRKLNCHKIEITPLGEIRQSNG